MPNPIRLGLLYINLYYTSVDSATGTVNALRPETACGGFVLGAIEL